MLILVLLIPAVVVNTHQAESWIESNEVEDEVGHIKVPWADKIHKKNAKFRDPMINPDLFEGDIMGIDVRELRNGCPMQRNLILESGKLWPDGEVPYEITPLFTSSDRSVIKEAIDTYQDNSCIKFVPRKKQKDYIQIIRGKGCSSYIGRKGGKQEVILGIGCVTKGIVIHEFLHALGFWHEQSRADRDDFVQVHLNNVQSGMEYNFQKLDKNSAQDLGITYDVGSVMHYGKHAFAKDPKKPTITTRRGSDSDMGQRKGFSQSDLKKLNKLYNCSRRGNGKFAISV